MRTFAPLIALAIAIWIGALIGNWITRKTGKKLVGWPAGIVAFLVLFTLATAALAVPRSYLAKADFKRAEPCPATNSARGACPGYVIDHVIPLACGGLDHPSNMQWQATADAKAKDRWERAGCKSSQ